MGTKRHLLTDGRGAPLALVITGANRHDVSQLELVLDTIVVERPESTQGRVQHLCADKAFDSPYAIGIIEDREYVPHVVSRGQERQDKLHTPGYRARRWVVEACHSWLNRFRKILVRYEKTDLSYSGLVHLACAIIVSRKAWAI
jgi:transposase